MKVYVLKSFSIENQFCNAVIYFTNKKKAIKSMSNLTDYLKYNHDLGAEISNEVETTTLIRKELDGKYVISLTTFEITQNIALF